MSQPEGRLHKRRDASLSLFPPNSEYREMKVSQSSQSVLLQTDVRFKFIRNFSMFDLIMVYNGRSVLYSLCVPHSPNCLLDSALCDKEISSVAACPALAKPIIQASITHPPSSFPLFPPIHSPWQPLFDTEQSCLPSAHTIPLLNHLR